MYYTIGEMARQMGVTPSTLRYYDKEERVRKELKAIEQSAGRHPEDKKEEKISLDIDLLSFDDRVLKPEDLKREYVVKGLEELKYNQI